LAQLDGKTFMSRSEQDCYDGYMKKRIPFPFAKALISSAVVLCLALSGGTAHASVCSQKAARLAAEKGGSVLRVASKGKRCRIKLLIRSRNGPPKRKTFVVPK